MEQSSEDSLDNRSGMNYSEEMLSLMRSMHSFMQAREEREATILQSNSDPAHPAPALVTAQPISSFQVASDPSVPSSPHVQAVPVAEPTSTQAGAHLAQAPDPPNNTLPAQASDPPANNLTSELNFLYEAISDLHHAVTGSEKKITQGTKNGPFKPRRFGLKKDPTTRDPLAANYDYTVKYPEDERYHELDSEARIWRVYGDEATAFDNDMVGELSDSLDILLVFAGLFSAVLTSFVAQTSQSLSQDNTQLSASYLSELTMLVCANGNSTTTLNIPPTITTFSPAILDLWVNGLWFTSLIISLSVALFAVLAKQWLRQYMSIITGTPREQALIRQFRFDGLEKWRVQSLIGLLPTLLHLALILFFAGLVIFLIPLSITMAYVTGAISVTVVVLYLTATVLPLFAVQCSYRTTLTQLLYSRVLYALFRRIYTIIISAYNWVWKQPMNVESAGSSGYMPLVGSNLKEEEWFTACHRHNQDLASLAWLGHYTSNPSAKSVLCRSLGAFPPEMSEKLNEVANVYYVLSHIRDHLGSSTNLDELEGWLRAGIHFSSMDQVFFIFRQPFYELNITDHNCDITSALSALAFGITPVKFFHAEQCIELAAEHAMDWVFETYEEDLPLDLPPLVRESLLRSSENFPDRDYLVAFIRQISATTVSSTVIRGLITSGSTPSLSYN